MEGSSLWSLPSVVVPDMIELKMVRVQTLDSFTVLTEVLCTLTYV